VGVWTAAHLPTPVRRPLFGAFRAVMAHQPEQARFAKEGQQALPSESPEAFGQFVNATLPIWAESVKDAGATAD
jgi:tripartite-type tricarboxylate transporter receptor subunit TctC